MAIHICQNADTVTALQIPAYLCGKPRPGTSVLDHIRLALSVERPPETIIIAAAIVQRVGRQGLFQRSFLDQGLRCELC